MLIQLALAWAGGFVGCLEVWCQFLCNKWWVGWVMNLVYIYIYIWYIFIIWDIYNYSISQLILQIVVKLRFVAMILRTQFMVSAWSWGQELPFSTSGRRSPLIATIDGRNPAFTSWGWQFIPLFTGFYTSQVVRDFFHQQYDTCGFDSSSNVEGIFAEKEASRFVAHPGITLKVSPVERNKRKTMVCINSNSCRLLSHLW